MDDEILGNDLSRPGRRGKGTDQTGKNERERSRTLAGRCGKHGEVRVGGCGNRGFCATSTFNPARIFTKPLHTGSVFPPVMNQSLRLTLFTFTRHLFPWKTDSGSHVSLSSAMSGCSKAVAHCSSSGKRHRDSNERAVLPIAMTGPSGRSRSGQNASKDETPSPVNPANRSVRQASSISSRESESSSHFQ